MARLQEPKACMYGSGRVGSSAEALPRLPNLPASRHRGYPALAGRPSDGRILENGEIAVLVQVWNLAGAAPDGSSVEKQGTGFDVVRRPTDGSWKMVLYNPWGVAVLD